MTTRGDGPDDPESPIGSEGWDQLESLYVWLRGDDGHKVARSWLYRRRLPEDLVDEILGESFSVLVEWVRRQGPFAEPDFTVPRLGTFAITKRGGPNVVRRRAGRPREAQLSVEGEGEYIEELPALAPAIEEAPQLALLALAQEHRNGRVSAGTYAAAHYFLSRHFGILERPSWIQSDPAGGTTDIEKLIWETYEYVSGAALERPLSQQARDDKRKLWNDVRSALRKILA